MCRIFALVRKDGKVAPIIRRALKMMEYGGYDSAGIGTIHDGHLFVKKGPGGIDEISVLLNFDDLPGRIGIGHTRWATHGAPSQVNAHPITDCGKEIAVVHNGIIENFHTIKQELMDKGHHFVSKTDTEVIAHLIEQHVKQGLEVKEACIRSARRLEGSFAVAMVSLKEPNKIFCLRRDSPLLIGIGSEGLYCSSDVVGFIEHTKVAVPLESGDFVVMGSDGYEITRYADGRPVIRREIEIPWTPEQALKEGYLHFMLKEIYEQPRSLRYVLSLQDRYLDLLTEFLDRARNIFLTAAGTSYHSCLAASYMYSKLAALPTMPVVASEFVEHYGRAINIDTAVLFVSQSGETADVLQAVEYCRLKAATILGVCNVLGSTLTRISRAYILQQSGPEIGVAATKTYTAQLLVHAQLALRLAQKRGKLSQDEVEELRSAIRAVPDLVESLIKTHERTARTLAERYAHKSCTFFLGKGISTATAYEGRLKLMEIAYIPSIAYPAGESKHGPISLVEEGFPVIFLAPGDESRRSILGNIMEMKARGAKTIVLGEEDDEELKQYSDEYIPMPTGIKDILTPITYVVPLQLFAYHSAVVKGLDPDKPRNLAKSVTVT